MKINVWVVILLAIAGIWFWKYGRDDGQRREDRAAEFRRAEDAKNAEESQRAALKAFADGMWNICTDRRKAAGSELAGVRKDSAQLSDVVTSAMAGADASDDRKFEAGVLSILKDAGVNTLAQKYIGTGFSDAAAELVLRVRDARAEKERYDAAVKDIDDAYAKNFKSVQGWRDSTKEQRDAEIARLNQEIRNLEKDRDRKHQEIQNTSQVLIKGNVHVVNAQMEERRVRGAKIADIQAQIDKKRAQIDSLRRPDQIQRFESEAIHKTQVEQDRAVDNRRRAMQDIDRRLKPKKSVVDVISEMEAKTVVRLRTAISAKLVECEKAEKALVDRIALIDEFRLAVPVTDLQTLRQMKSKISK